MRHELRTKDRVAYLIEMPNPAVFGIKSPGPLYYAVQGFGEKSCPATFWTSHAVGALQFSRRDQANAFLEFIETANDGDLSSRFSVRMRDQEAVLVTEHIFEEVDA